MAEKQERRSKMNSLQNWYDEMKTGQRIFVWLVSVVLALAGFVLGQYSVMLRLDVKGFGDAPSYLIDIDFYLLYLLGFPFFIPLVVCIYLALGRR
jgi:hypothetical protein